MWLHHAVSKNREMITLTKIYDLFYGRTFLTPCMFLQIALRYYWGDQDWDTGSEGKHCMCQSPIHGLTVPNTEETKIETRVLRGSIVCASHPSMDWLCPTLRRPRLIWGEALYVPVTHPWTDCAQHWGDQDWDRGSEGSLNKVSKNIRLKYWWWLLSPRGGTQKLTKYFKNILTWPFIGKVLSTLWWHH
jgi:hypothetical protein